MIISSTGLGLQSSSRLRTKIEICTELSAFCDELILDLSYSVTPIIQLVEKKFEDKKHLNFISSKCIKCKSSLISPLSQAENSELSSFLYSLGKSDLKTQIKLIQGFKDYIEYSKNQYSVHYDKSSKVYVCYGAFIGIVVSLVLI